LKRFPFLDWMRGLAVVVMIQCHTFNCFTRPDLRGGGPYVLSQFVGGMAAPLFLFMAGMTFAFQMESLERREPHPWRRWLTSLRRAGYIFLVALLFRFTNWLGAYPHANTHEITRVDILNCMGVAMAAFSVAALFRSHQRARFAAAAGLAIAAVAPLLANLSWQGVPPLLREYLVPAGALGQFPFFPLAAYVGFGLATGTVVKRTSEVRFDRFMQWAVLIGFGLFVGAEYFANVPFSVYPQSDFWTNSPSLILIRVGIMLLMMATAYLWTQYAALAGWSWMQCLGKNSLMVYWVHVVMVYGALGKPLRRTMSVPRAAFTTAALTATMVGLSAVWLWWKARRARLWKAATSVAGGGTLLTATEGNS